MARRVLDFVNESVFPQEEMFAHHRYMHVRGLGAWSNTPLEGTNRGLKYAETNVRPDMGLAESTKTLLTQDKDRWMRKNKVVADALVKHNLRSDSQTSDHITKEAEGDLMREYQNRHNYASRRMGANKWEVLFMNKRVHSKLIPNFERVRVVSIAEDGTINCTCSKPEDIGMPCRHISHVLECYSNDFEGFVSQDVDIRYHNIYCSYVAYKPQLDLSDEEKEIRAKLLNLRRSNPAQLPVARCEMNSVESAVGKKIDFAGSIADHIENMQKVSPICSNYTKQQMEKALQKHGLGGSFREVRHNVPNGTYDDDASVDWTAFTGGGDQHNTPERTLYEKTKPIIKELHEVYDGASPETHNRVCAELERLVHEGTRKRALDFDGGAPPCGKKVSGKVAQKNAPRKQAKQR